MFMKAHFAHDPSALQDPRAAAVRSAIRHAWQGYVAFAWGHDELRPLSKGFSDSFCGSGVTVVDSMSTLWLAGLKDEFNAAREWVIAKNYSTFSCNMFETNIRVVGGLLSAAALSNDPALVSVAKVIVDRMVPSFGTASGIPCNSFSVASCGTAVLAEAGTFTLEFTALSRATGDPVYEALAVRSVKAIVSASRTRCASKLFSTHVSVASGEPTECVSSVGGEADSFYEYLLKYAIMTGDRFFRDVWSSSMDAVRDELVQCSTEGVPMLSASRAGTRGQTLEHLACFAPGMLVLGDPEGRGALAEGLLEGCLGLYRTPSHIGADSAKYLVAGNVSCLSAPVRRMGSSDIVAFADSNYQRPEVFESLFYMWRARRDERYRQLAWEFFTAIATFQKVESGGFGGSRGVTRDHPDVADQQDSFFIAESLKYLFLIFSDDSVLDLKRWVINTEAHPLPIFANSV